MKKLGFLLLALLASKGASASEVGAPIPQMANSTAVLAVAIAETGAAARWTHPQTQAEPREHNQAASQTVSGKAETDDLERLSQATFEQVNVEAMQRIAKQLRLGNH